MNRLTRPTTSGLGFSAAVTCFLACLLSAPNGCFAQAARFEQPPIDYINAPTSDAVAQLAAKLEDGTVKLDYDERHGYLPAILDALDIPVSSQTLVFSKTSLQLHRISPRQPRALYFNDDVYIGWCQRGDVLEIAATDARQGAIFYTLDQIKSESPVIVRDQGQCLTCHASSRTQNVPGYLVRSVQATAAGHPILGSGTYTNDHTSPFNERWGGWYVTGTHGDMRHMGNVISKKPDTGTRDTEPDVESGANVTQLINYFETDNYLTPHSDIVALMTLTHQSQTHNALTTASFETREAMHQSFEMNEILDREPGYLSDSAERRIDAVADNVVKHLLMCGEFELTSPIAGTSSFAEEFQSKGPFDPQGRSLRQLDLQTQRFKYPCSYLIYSPAFDALPDEVRTRIISKMRDVLTGQNQQAEFQHLTHEARTAIHQILSATKSEFKQ